MQSYFKTYFLPKIIVLTISIAFLFIIKTKVQELTKSINVLSKQILSEQESIHILRAEYSYLTNPQRLKKLIDKNLSLQLAKNNQVLKIDNVNPYLQELITSSNLNLKSDKVIQEGQN